MALSKRVVATLAVAAIGAAGAAAYARAAQGPFATLLAHVAVSASPTPLPTGAGPLFSPDLPVALAADVEPLGVSPDGLARWLVRARFTDAAGAPVTLVRGGDVAISASAGSVQWQSRLRFGGPAAIVSTPIDARLAVLVRADVGVALAPASATLVSFDLPVPHIVARALGPHLVRIGWFPRAPGATVRLGRDGKALALVAGEASTYRDASVEAGRSYRYDVVVPGRERATLVVAVPPEAPHAPLAALGGTSAWLSFSANPLEANSYATLDARAIVERARSAGLRSIQLRVAYGPFDEVTPEAKPFIDALLDEAAARGLAVVAWTVPRSCDFDDLAATTGAASYRTAAGNGFAGIAVDLERGDDFLGNGSAGYAALARYLGDVRAALGPQYPLIATVEDPFLEHLSGRTYPYAAIARSASVLQPMSYWRMLSKKAVTPEAVAQVLAGSYAAVAREAGRSIPIDVGGQTSGEGPRGAPTGPELAAAVTTGKRLGAFGLTFFDWAGTSEEQWAAIAATPW